MTTVRKFEMPRVQSVVEGPGAIRSLPAELDRRGLSRCVLVTSRSISKADYFDQLVSDLGTRLVATSVTVQPHNPIDSILSLVETAREHGADTFVSVGGGSTVDAAKLAAAGLAQDCRTVEDLARNYVTFTYPDGIEIRPLDTRPVPVLAAPTTLSAAEWNGFAGSTDPQREAKDITCYLELTPEVVFLDPNLCARTPRGLWATTGIRAVDHAVETSYAKNAHPFTTALATDALGMLAENLPRSARDPFDFDAALACLQAAWMSVIGSHNVSLGLSHAIGHQLGAVGIPHGVTSCIAMPHVVRFLEPATVEQQRRIASTLAGAQGDGEALSAADRLARLITELGVPRQVSDFDVPNAKIPIVARAALRDIVIKESPREINEATMVELLETIWSDAGVA